MTNSKESNKGEIVMYQPDETIRLEVLGKRLFAFELMGIDKNIILNQL